MSEPTVRNLILTVAPFAVALGVLFWQPIQARSQDSLNDTMALQRCITNVRSVYAQWDYQTKPYLKGAMQAALETCPT